MTALSEGELLRRPFGRRRRWKGSPIIAISLVFVALIIILVIFGPLLAPKDPNAQDLAIGLRAPGGASWLGTDELGRDTFSRVIVGARTAVIGPVLIALGSLVGGGVLGLLAGYAGGWVDAVISRWVDGMLAVPGLLIVVVVAGVVGGGYLTAVALLILFNIPYDTRIIRGATMEQRPLAYVEAARVLGLSVPRLLVRHVWPNVLPLALANTFLNFAYGIVVLSGLSFLGVGVAPGAADWGRMIAEGRGFLIDNPAYALAPAVLIVLTAASMNLLGDRVYEWLSDRGRSE